jgi:hypothetical protein
MSASFGYHETLAYQQALDSHEALDNHEALDVTKLWTVMNLLMSASFS